MLFSEIIIGIDVSVPYRVCVCLYASKVLTFFVFVLMSRDAKALQEKTAKKAAQDAAGGSKK
jgi:hypothetical protein